MSATDFALLVGIDRYLSPSLQQLNAPVADANDLYTWLRRPDGGDVPDANIVRITTETHPWGQNPGPGAAHPSAQDFTDGMEMLWELVRQNDPGTLRRLYLYFSGHGYEALTSAVNEAVLYTARHTTFNPEHLPGTRWAAKARKSGCFDEVVLLMDCCRTQTEGIGVADPIQQLIGCDEGRPGVREFQCYSVATGIAALEREIGPNNAWRSIFTFMFLEALDHAIPEDGTGNVTTMAVKNYIRSRWVAAGFGDVPEPDIRVADPEIVLVTRALVTPPEGGAEVPLVPPTKFTVKVDPKPPSGATVDFFRFGEEAPFLSAPVKKGKAVAELTPGFYRIRLSGGPERTAIIEVIGEAGSERI